MTKYDITSRLALLSGKLPFILCCMGNEVDAPAYERFMRDSMMSCTFSERTFPADTTFSSPKIRIDLF